MQDTNTGRQYTFDSCEVTNFAEGNEYYYYPQLFHIAANLVNIEKGFIIFKRNRRKKYACQWWVEMCQMWTCQSQ